MVKKREERQIKERIAQCTHISHKQSFTKIKLKEIIDASYQGWFLFDGDVVWLHVYCSSHSKKKINDRNSSKRSTDREHQHCKTRKHVENVENIKALTISS